MKQMGASEKNATLPKYIFVVFYWNFCLIKNVFFYVFFLQSYFLILKHKDSPFKQGSPSSIEKDLL